MLRTIGSRRRGRRETNRYREQETQKPHITRMAKRKSNCVERNTAQHRNIARIGGIYVGNKIYLPDPSYLFSYELDVIVMYWLYEHYIHGPSRAGCLYEHMWLLLLLLLSWWREKEERRESGPWSQYMRIVPYLEISVCVNLTRKSISADIAIILDNIEMFCVSSSSFSFYLLGRQITRKHRIWRLCNCCR